MPVDLPDINFGERRDMEGGNAFVHTLDELFYHERHDLNFLRFNTEHNPGDILRQAFEKYIVNNAIQNNTIGINIIYIGNENELKNIFIAKRSYQGNTTQNILTNTEHSEYVNPNQIENGAIFENRQIDGVIDRIRNFQVVQITICEVYHDNPESQRRALNGRAYYPMVIPIELLYRNIPDEMYRRRHQEQREEEQQREEQREQRILREQQREQERENAYNPTMPNYSPQRRGRNEPAESPFFRTYEPGDTCGICIEGLSNGEPVCVNKNCTHGFHCGCINEWLERRSTCPVCRERFERVELSEMQQSSIQNMGFGKTKRSKMTLKQIDKFIKEIKLMR